MRKVRKKQLRGDCLFIAFAGFPEVAAARTFLPFINRPIDAGLREISAKPRQLTRSGTDYGYADSVSSYWFIYTAYRRAFGRVNKVPRIAFRKFMISYCWQS